MRRVGEQRAVGLEGPTQQLFHEAADVGLEGVVPDDLSRLGHEAPSVRVAEVQRDRSRGVPGGHDDPLPRDRRRGALPEEEHGRDGAADEEQPDRHAHERPMTHRHLHRPKSRTASTNDSANA